MESDKVEEPIFDLAGECERLFASHNTRLHVYGEQSGAKLLLDLNQRFLAWAAFLGVFAEPNVCLDRKLRHHVDIQDQVLLLLDILRKNLAYLFDSDQPSDPMDVDSKDNSQLSSEDLKLNISSLEAVSKAVDRLNHLGIAIRRSSIVSQATKARAFAERFDLNSFERVAYLSLQALYADASQGLLEQLARSMTETYARFLHRKSRQGRLQTRRRRVEIPEHLYRIVEDEIIDAEKEMRMSNTISTPEPSTDLLTPMPRFSRRQITRSLPLSEPTSIDSKEVREKFKKLLNPSVKRKTMSILANQVDYPRPAKGSLICDWCFSPIPVESAEGAQWQQHVNEDNEPYVCVSEKCSEALPKFATSTKWFQHMLSSHGHKWHQEVHAPSSWVCPLCTDEKVTFSKPEDLMAHLEQVHEGIFTALQIQAITNQSRFQVPRPRGFCPLCCLSIRGQKTPQSKNTEDEGNMPSSELIGSHVAGHLQSIMLLTLRLISIDVAVDVSNDSESTTNGTEDRSSWTGSGQADLGENPKELEISQTSDDDNGLDNDEMSTGSDQIISDAVPDTEYIDWDYVCPPSQDHTDKSNNQEIQYPEIQMSITEPSLVYCCLLCSPYRNFSRLGTFIRHVNDQHQPKSFFKCMLCDYKHPRLDKLSIHLLIDHSRALNGGDILRSSCEVIEPVPVVCNICVSQNVQSHPGPFQSWESWFQGIESHCVIDLDRRQSLIRGFLLGEQDFVRDLGLIQIFYRRTAELGSKINLGDTFVLFGHVDKFLNFANTFLESLKQACYTVYTTKDVQTQSHPMTTNVNKFERDQETSIGRTFMENISGMEEAFGDYSKRHDDAQRKLISLVTRYPEVREGLQDYEDYASDSTNVPGLEDLLERPMQRFLEYRRFLTALEKCTPPLHPDSRALTLALTQLNLISGRIIGTKEEIESVTPLLDPVEKERGTRAGFSISNDKLIWNETSPSSTAIAEDTPPAQESILQEIQAIHGEKYRRLKVLLRDFLKYTTEIRGLFEAFKNLIRPLTESSSLPSPSRPSSVRDRLRLIEINLEDYFNRELNCHVEDIQTKVIKPISILLEVYDKYQKAFEMKQFVNLGEKLQDEIPKLFSMTDKLIRACLGEFAQTQERWYRSFEEKLKAVTGIECIGVQDILNDWRADTSMPFSEISKLGICTSGEETIESRVARIKARIAELTGNMEPQ